MWRSLALPSGGLLEIVGGGVPYSQDAVHVALKQGIGAAPVPGLGEGVSSIQGILSDAGVSGRATAALLLGRDKDPDVLPALRDALSDKDASVRAAAAHSIAVRNDPALSQDLIPLLDDKKESVRLRAAAGYLRLAYVKAQDESAKARVPPKAAPSAKRAVPAGKGK